MRKRTAKISLGIISVIVITIGLVFLFGKSASGRYCDVKLNDRELSEILGKTAHEIIRNGDIEILIDNREKVRDCVLMWLKERNKATESFYLFIMETLEGNKFSLINHRGAVWFHRRALRAIEVLNYKDEEIANAIIKLDEYYRGSGYYIEGEIEKIRRDIM